MSIIDDVGLLFPWTMAALHHLVGGGWYKKTECVYEVFHAHAGCHPLPAVFGIVVKSGWMMQRKRDGEAGTDEKVERLSEMRRGKQSVKAKVLGGDEERGGGTVYGTRY